MAQSKRAAWIEKPVLMEVALPGGDGHVGAEVPIL